MTKHLSYAHKARQVITAVIIACCAVFLFLFSGCLEGRNSESNIEKIHALYRQSKRNFPDTPDLSVDELIRRQKREKVVLVDNRGQAERDVSMIPGAISSQDFESDIESYKENTVVVYCTIGDRSGHYTKKLRKRNIDAYNLQGGVLAWAHAGGTFVDDRGNETNLVHVYGAKWNLLPEGYRSVW